MTSSPEGDLFRRYHQFLQDFPRQQTTLAGDQCWSWIDSAGGQNAGALRTGCSGQDDRGDNPLVMLPGLLGEAETSFLYLQALAESVRVVAVSFPPAVGQVADFCDGLCALLDHLDIPRATILGGSAGGYLAQAFARRAPDRTGGLILTHTGLPSRAQARANQGYLGLLRIVPFAVLRGLLLPSVFAFFPRLTSTHAFWRAHFRTVIRGLSRAALINRIALMEDFHRRCHFHPGDLAVEPNRILLMEMQRDRLTSAAEQAEMRNLYRGAKLHIFADTAHYDAVENPVDQIRVILDFMITRD